MEKYEVSMHDKILYWIVVLIRVYVINSFNNTLVSLFFKLAANYHAIRFKSLHAHYDTEHTC